MKKYLSATFLSAAMFFSGATQAMDIVRAIASSTSSLCALGSLARLGASLTRNTARVNIDWVTFSPSPAVSSPNSRPRNRTTESRALLRKPVEIKLIHYLRV